jgi:hypothetical protein
MCSKTLPALAYNNSAPPNAALKHFTDRDSLCASTDTSRVAYYIDFDVAVGLVPSWGGCPDQSATRHSPRCVSPEDDSGDINKCRVDSTLYTRNLVVGCYCKKVRLDCCVVVCNSPPHTRYPPYAHTHTAAHAQPHTHTYAQHH